MKRPYISKTSLYAFGMVELGILLSFIIFFATSCAGVMGGAKDFAQMSPKEKAIFLMKTYNKQYDDYIALYEKGNWNDQEKQILKQKYEALTEIHKYVKLYAGYAETGAIAPEATEQAAIMALNKLLGI